MDYDQLLERYHSYFGMEMKDAYYLNEYTHTLPWATCVIYVLMVFYLPKLLKKDEKKEEKKEEAAPAKEGEKKHRAKPKLTLISYVMAFWNLFLSVLSLAMLLGVGIPFWRIMYNKGLFDGLCDEGGVFWEQKDPMLYWAYIFALSKYAELIDTLFLIIKHPERPVPFLHWYHHWTVLLFTWYSVHNRFGTGGAFLTVNAFVHTVMYFYYFLKELNYDPTIIALPITIIQISQMVLGIYFVSVWTYMHYKVNGNCTCNNREIILASCVVMYGSYLFLFCKYFYYRYICGIMPGKSKPEGAAPAKKTQKADQATF